MFRANVDVDRAHVIATFRGHESELRASGITHLALFGSTARETIIPIPMSTYLPPSTILRVSLLAVVGIEQRISPMLGRAVDLVEEGALKSRVWKSVEAEAVRAF